MPPVRKAVEVEGNASQEPDQESDSAEDYLERGIAYSDAGDEVKAAQNYAKALADNPDLGRIYLDQGISDYFLGNYIDAYYNLERAEALFEAGGDLQRIGTAREYRQKLRSFKEDKEVFGSSLKPF